MLDIPATLRSPTGVATNYSVRRPDPPDELLWCTAVEVDTGQDAADLPPSMVTVGAYGHTRGDSLVRGAGEAVERYALYPGPRGDAPWQPRPVHASAEELDEASLDYSAAGVALGAPDSVGHRIDWYRHVGSATARGCSSRPLWLTGRSAPSRPHTSTRGPPARPRGRDSTTLCAAPCSR